MNTTRVFVVLFLLFLLADAVSSAEMPLVTIQATDPTASEPGTDTGTFTLARTGDTSAALTVVFNTTGSTATSGTDYTSIGTSKVIPAGSASVTITITPVNNTTAENDETVIVTIDANAAYTVGNPNTAIVTIIDEEIPYITAAATDATASETGPDNGQFTITRTGNTLGPITVYFSLSGATNGTDYITLPTSVVIPTGQSSVTLDVVPIDDAVAETSPENVGLTLTAHASYTKLAGTFTIGITDNEPRVSIVATDASATEGGDGGTITITRTESTAQALTVSFSIATGTGKATSGTDFTAIGTSIIIPAGSSSVQIPINTVNDGTAENNEDVTVTITANTAYLVTTATATVTIFDDDPAVVTITSSGAASTASEPGADTGVFTLTRVGNPTSSLVVDYTLSGTATNGTDYTTLSGQVTFAAASASATVTVTPLDDTFAEPNETVIVTLGAGTGYTIGTPGNSTVTIWDNEQTITVAATDPTAGETPTNTGVFTLTRIGLPTATLVANYTLSGTATNGSDYSSLTGTVTFGVNAATATVTVTPVNDAVVEGDETVILTLSNSAAYTLGSPNNATVNLVDNDVVVSITATDTNASEPGIDTGTFALSRSGNTTGSLTVSITRSGTAAVTNDFTGLPSTAATFNVTFDPGVSTLTYTITPADNATAENDETVILTVNTSTAYVVGSPNSATVTIIDEDLPSVSATATDATASEPGTDSGSIRFTRVGNTLSELTVNYTVTGTATSGSDYTLLPGSVAIPIGAAFADVAVTPLDDSLAESNTAETVIVAISANANYTISGSNPTVSITDDEPRVSVAATDATANELGGDTGTFTFTRTGPTTSALEVTYTIGGTAVNGTDYQTIGTTLTIPVGSATATLVITPIDDPTGEPSETIIVTPVATSAYQITGSGVTVTLVDDEPIVSVTATDATASEPGTDTGTYTFTRTGPTVNALEIFYTVSSTATVGSDYQALGTSIIIPVGASSETLTLTALDDLFGEINETVTVTISLHSSYTRSGSGATVTISDDEPRVSVSSSDLIASEPGTDTATFTITRTGPTTETLEVFYAMTLTAVNGTDYQLLPGSVTIPVGASSANVVLTPLNDTVAENNETAKLTLSVHDGYLINGTATLTATIWDDDPNEITIGAAGQYAVATEPGADTGIFSLSRVGNITNALTVYYTISGTAINGTDYVQLPSSISFAANSSTASIIITAIDDTTPEIDETVILTLDANANYTAAGTGSATITIVDNEQIVSVSATDNSSRESYYNNQAGTFTFSRSGVITAALTVNYTVSGTAINGTDYTTISGTIVIPAQYASKTLAITPINDTIEEADETAIVTISASAAYAIGAANTATMNVSDNDATVSIVASDPIASEEGPDPGKFTITRSTVSALPLVVGIQNYYSSANGYDVPDLYLGVGASATIPANETSVDLYVIPFDDEVNEGSETITIKLVYSTEYIVSSFAPVTVTILDNEVKISVTATDPDAAETGANPGKFTFTRDIVNENPVTVYFYVSGDATSGTDYTSIGTSVIIPANQASVDVDVNVIDDTIADNNETVTVTIQTNSFYSIGTPNSATVTITDEDPRLTTIEVSPVNQVIRSTHTQQYAALGYDQYNAPLVPQPTFSWSVSLNGSISGTGLLTAGSTIGGPYNVIATSGAISGSAPFSVIPDDTTAPSITNLQPTSGVFTNLQTPVFSAAFADGDAGVDPDSVIILLDGVDVTAQAQISATGFQYTPANPLPEGARTLSVAVADFLGNTQNASTIVNVDITPPPAPVIDQVFREQDRIVVIGSAPAGVATLLASANGATIEPSLGSSFIATFSKNGNNSFTYSMAFVDNAGNTGAELANTENFPAATPVNSLKIVSAQVIVPPGTPLVVRNNKQITNATSVDLRVVVMGGVRNYSCAIAGTPINSTASGNVFQTNINTTVAGEYLLPIILTDAEGNTATESVIVVIDRTGPAIRLTTPLKTTSADIYCLVLGPADKEIYSDPKTQNAAACRNVFGANTFKPEADLEDQAGTVEITASVRVIVDGNLTFFRDFPYRAIYATKAIPDSTFQLTPNNDLVQHWALPNAGSLTTNLQDYARNRRSGVWQTDLGGAGQEIPVTLPEIDIPLYMPDTQMFSEHYSYQLVLKAKDALGNETEEKVLSFLVDKTAPEIRAIRWFNPVLTVTSDEDVYEMFQNGQRMRREHLLNPLTNSTWRLATPVPFTGMSLTSEPFSITAEDLAGNVKTIGAMTVQRNPMRVAESWQYSLTAVFPDSQSNFINPVFNNGNISGTFNYTGHNEDGNLFRFLAGDSLLAKNFSTYGSNNTVWGTLDVPSAWQGKSYKYWMDFLDWPYEYGLFSSLYYNESTGSAADATLHTAESNAATQSTTTYTMPWDILAWGGFAARRKDGLFSSLATPVRLLLPRTDEMYPPTGVMPGGIYDLWIPRNDGCPSYAVFLDAGAYALDLDLKQFWNPDETYFVRHSVPGSNDFGPLFRFIGANPDLVASDPRTTQNLDAPFSGQQSSIYARLIGVPRDLPAGWSDFQYLISTVEYGDEIFSNNPFWASERATKLNFIRVAPTWINSGSCQTITVKGAELTRVGETATVGIKLPDGQNIVVPANTPPETATDKIIVRSAKGVYYNFKRGWDNGAMGLAGDLAHCLEIDAVIGADVPGGVYDIVLTTPNGLNNYTLTGALKIERHNLTVDANYDGNINGQDDLYEFARNGVVIASQFGIPNTPSISSRVRVKLDCTRNRGIAQLFVSNSRVKVFDQPTSGTEFESGFSWILNATPPPADIYLEFARDEEVSLELLSYLPGSPTPIPETIISSTLKIVRLSNGLGAPDSISAQTEVVPGHASISLMRGNLYFGAVARQYQTPAAGPDVFVSYNHLEGTGAGLGFSWRSNYDMRVYDTASVKCCGGAVEMSDRQDGDLLALIDETGRRHLFEYDSAFGKFASRGDSGLVAAKIDPDTSHFDPDGKLGYAYKLHRNDNRFCYFNKDGWLVRTEDLRKKGVTISRASDGKALVATDDYSRAEALTASTFGGTPGSNLGVLSGRELAGWDFIYNGEGNVSQITLDGNTYSVQYDADAIKPSSITIQGGFFKNIAFSDSTKDPVTSATITEPTGGNTVYTINTSLDAWTAITNAEAITTSRTLDSATRRVTQTTTGRASTSFTYDSLGNTTSVAVSGGTTTNYTYSSFGITDANLLASSELVGAGGSTQLDYYTAAGIEGLLKSTTAPDGAETTYSYNNDGFLSSTLDARGKTWTVLGHNRYGQPLASQSPEGRLTQKSFDGLGRVATVKDSMNYLTRYTYDIQGRLAAVTEPGGAESAMEYDALGRVTSSTDLQGRTTTTVYDGIGRPTSITQPGIGPVTIAYTQLAYGTKVETTQGGRTTTQNLDFIGRPSQSIVKTVLTPGAQAVDCVTSYLYTPGEGWLDQVLDPIGNATTYAYDNAGRTTSVTSQLGATQSTVYDTAGNVESVTSPDGQMTVYGYDPVGRVVETTNPAGGIVITNYDELGNVLSVAPSVGNAETFTYDDDGVQKTRTDVFGKVHEITIDEANRKVTTKVDNNNTRSVSQYLDGRGLINQVESAAGMTQLVKRDDGLTTSVTPPGRGAYSSSFDSLDRVTTSTTPVSSTTNTYDAVTGDVLKRQNVLGNEVNYANNAVTGDFEQSTDTVGGANNPTVKVLQRDKNGNVLKYADAENREWRQEFDDDGRRTKLIPPDLIETVWSLSPGGRVNSITTAFELTRIEYNDLNQPVKVIDPTFRETENVYDEFGTLQSTKRGGAMTSYTRNAGTQQITAITAPGGVTTSLLRDTFGRVTKVTDAENHETQYAYDDQDRVTLVTHPDTKTESFTYYTNGDLKDHTDRMGRVTRHVYDNAGRLTQKQLLDTNETVVLTYNAANKVTSETYNGNVSRTYDGRGRLTSVSQDGQTTSYTYRNDNAISTKTYAAQTLNYNYNSTNGRLDSISGADGTANFSYLANGRLGSIQLPGSVTRTFAYDGAGRTTSLAQNVNGSTETHAISYDAQGRLKKLASSNHAIAYSYDAAGRLLSERRTGTGAYNQAYNFSKSGNQLANSRVDIVIQTLDFSGAALPAQGSVISGNWTVSGGKLHGDGSDNGRLSLNLSPDSGNHYSVKVQPQTATLGAGDEVSAGVYFGEDAEGRYVAYFTATKVDVDGTPTLKRKLRVLWLPISGGSEIVAQTSLVNYDGSALTLSLDVAFDKLVLLVAEDDGLLPELTVELSHGSAGALGLEISGLPVAALAAADFDDFSWASNTAPAQQRTYTYNAMHQLSGPDYVYDDAGRLTQSVTNGVATTYTYDRLNRLTSANVGGTVSNYTYYGPSWMRKTASVGGVTTNYTYDGHACVAQTTGGVTTTYRSLGGRPVWETTNGQTLSYTQDVHGNVTGLWNGTSYAAKFNYNAFGKVSATDGAGAPIANTSGPRFRGEQYDAATDQVYLRNRYYSPDSGRFNAIDPKGMVDGPNMYQYCAGDPVNRADPDGTRWHYDKENKNPVWHDDGDGPVPYYEPYGAAALARYKAAIPFYDVFWTSDAAGMYYHAQLMNQEYWAREGFCNAPPTRDRLIKDTIVATVDSTLTAGRAVAAIETGGLSEAGITAYKVSQAKTVTEVDELLTEYAWNQSIGAVVQAGGNKISTGSTGVRIIDRMGSRTAAPVVQPVNTLGPNDPIPSNLKNANPLGSKYNPAPAALPAPVELPALSAPAARATLPAPAARAALPAPPVRAALPAPSAQNLISSVAQSHANSGIRGLRYAMKGHELPAYLRYPNEGSRYLGTAVHRATYATLQKLYPGRFRYYGDRPDFLDTWTGEIIELTTPRQVIPHKRRSQDYKDATYSTYTLP